MARSGPRWRYKRPSQTKRLHGKMSRLRKPNKGSDARVALYHGNSRISVAERTLLQEAGVSMHHWRREDEMQRGCDLYREGWEVAAIAGSLGVSEGTVRRILRQRDVELRPPREAHRLYRCDHDFFSVVDCEVKAYWLGFLSGDGNVYCGSIQMGLQRRDRAHLVRLLADLRSTHRVYDWVNGVHEYSSVSVRSPQMVADLARFGVVPRKSFTVPFPESLSDELLQHWCRGYVDANGSICRRAARGRERKGQLHFAVAGNRGLVEGMQTYLMHMCGLSRTKLDVTNPPEQRIDTLRYGGNVQVPRILRLLHDGATVWLERKKIALA